MFLKNFNVKISEQHPYHILSPSPWPIFTSINLYLFLLSIVLYFHFYIWGFSHLIFSLITLLITLFGWFSDIVFEATFEGQHTIKVQKNILVGMLLFIISEIMFFLAFFWGFFHFSISPSIFLGGIWPPLGIKPFDPLAVPLLNTIILVSSGFSVTWSHRAIILGYRKEVILSLIQTIGYGIFFTILQGYEYTTASFSINDTTYGSIFFILTGFHGLHVLIGTIFLIVCLIRQIFYHFYKEHHIGFVCCIWYWHFVDVIWIFVFFIVYCWSNFW